MSKGKPSDKSDKPLSMLSTLEQMAAMVDDSTLKRSFDTLIKHLDAKKRVRTSQRGVYEDIDDTTAQARAAELLITLRLGRPAATNLNLNVNQDNTKTKETNAQVVQRLADGVDLGKILRSVQRYAQIETAQDAETDETIDI